MTFEKLSYSRTECNNYLHFSFDADQFNTILVITELGLEPTSLMTKKAPVPKSMSWKHRIDTGNKIDINPEGSTPYFGFNKRTIDFLSKTESEVDFNLYKSVTIRLLKND